MGVLMIMIKVMVVTTTLALPLVLLLVRRWRLGSIALPASGLIYTATLLPIAYLLSVIFAQDKFNAVMSLRFDTDSLVMISLGVLAMFTVVLSSVNNGWLQRIDFRRVMIWIIAVAAFVFSLQILWQLVFGSVPVWLSSVSIVGSWVDISILLAMLVVLILSGQPLNVQTPKRTKIVKVAIVAILMLVLSLFLHTMAILSLLFLIATVQIIAIIAKSDGDLNKTLLLLPSMVVVFAGLFILDSTLLNGRVTATVQSVSRVSFVDIRPNWQGTVTVAKGALEEAGLNERLFGPGVGSFAEQWRVYKPVAVNTTRFWSSDFNYAVGFIPTTIITGGIVVFAAWLVFFFMLIKLLLLARRSKLAYATLFIWVVMLFSPVDYLLLLIAFVLTGALLREAVKAELIKVNKYKLRGEGMSKPLSYIAIPLLVIVSLGTLLVVSHRVIVNTYLLKASGAMLAGNSNKAEQLLSRAKMFADLDIIEQGYTRIAFAKLITLLSDAQANKTEVGPEALQSALSNVLSHARSAIEKDPTDPVNYMALGSISEQLMGLQIEGARESAEAAYLQAAALDPLNPAIPFALARISVADEDKTKFVTYLEQALTIKPNYVPALYQYALLQLANGNKDAAAQLLTAVLQVDNNNANALYYLAALYFEQGRVEEALILMQRVQLLNPDNEEVAKIVESFKAQLQQANDAATTEEVTTAPEGN